jgi:hypothetical protein
MRLVVVFFRNFEMKFDINDLFTPIRCEMHWSF